MAALLRTPEECFEAGRRRCRERGDKLSPERALLIAAILRPYAGQLFGEPADTLPHSAA